MGVVKYRLVLDPQGYEFVYIEESPVVYLFGCDLPVRELKSCPDRRSSRKLKLSGSPARPFRPVYFHPSLLLCRDFRNISPTAFV